MSHLLSILLLSLPSQSFPILTITALFSASKNSPSSTIRPHSHCEYAFPHSSPRPTYLKWKLAQRSPAEPFALRQNLQHPLALFLLRGLFQLREGAPMDLGLDDSLASQLLSLTLSL